MRSFFLGTMLGLLGVAFIGCADGVVSQGSLGKLSANLVIAPGYDVTEINYEISGPGIETMTGTIPVATNPVEAIVGGIPVGTGYTIKLSTADGKCSGSTQFDVIANEVTAATVNILCSVTADRGGVDVTAPFTFCPTITSVVVAPSKVATDGTISVKVNAKDLSGAAMAIAWTVSAGSFADPAAAATTYSCSVGGIQTLTVKASNANCSDSLSIRVDCGAAVELCGNTIKEGFEECDDGNRVNNDGCSATCKIEKCGDGVVQTNEECDPPNGTTCDANCKIIVLPKCGDGHLDANEECDDGNTANNDGCSATCKIEKCGDGVVQTNETCDTAILTGTGACPTDATCNDNKVCTTDTIENNHTCTAKCVHATITTPVCGDGCVSGTEQCEPPNTQTCDASCQNIVCEDITGTWIMHLNTTGTITQGSIVIPDVNIDYIIRLYNKKESGNLVSKLEICELAAGASGLVTTYSDAVIKTFTASGSIPDFCAKLKEPVTIPTFQILSGTKSATLPTGSTSPCSSDPTSTCDAAPDTDGDGKYGITLKTTMGIISITTYTGLVITVSLNDLALDNATTLSGTTSFLSNGFVWGTSLGYGVGPIIVALNSNALPIESYLLPGHGDVSCSQVLNYCTTGPTGVCTP